LHLFRKIFAKPKLSNFYRIKFEFDNQIILIFAKGENPKINFFRIALLLMHGGLGQE